MPNSPRSWDLWMIDTYVKQLLIENTKQDFQNSLFSRYSEDIDHILDMNETEEFITPLTEEQQLDY